LPIDDGSPTAVKISLDFAPTELIARRLRRVALVSAEVGLAVGLVSAIFVRWQVAVVIAVVVGAPVAIFAYFMSRRRMWLAGTVVHSTRAFSTRRLDLAHTVTAELLVRIARFNQVSVLLSDGSTSVTVLLAIYLDAAGRELEPLPLRKLADALATSELVAAAAVSSVLLQQLRAEARDAVLGERPLYQAMALARDSGRSGLTALTDAEVAALVN